MADISEIKLPDNSTYFFKDTDARQSISNLQDWTSADTKTVSDNPITITDCSTLPAKALSVDFEPIQDFHGYDAPWAGGAGKNLLPMTVDNLKALNPYGWSGNSYHSYGIGFVVIQTDTDGNVIGIEMSGDFTYAWGSIDFFKLCSFTLKAGTYKIYNNASANIDTAKFALTYKDESGTKIYVGTNENATITFTEDKDNFEIYLTLRSTYLLSSAVTMTPVFCISTADSTFEPYTNICPISGRTNSSVMVCGKNIFDGDWHYGWIDSITGHIFIDSLYEKKYHDYIRVKPLTWYTMSAYNLGDTLNYFNIFGYDKNKNYVGAITVNILSQTTDLLAEKFQIPSNVAFIQMHISTTTLGTSDKQQLEIGETYTDYEAYQSHAATTITFGQTVYGGQVDFKTGNVTVEWGYIASYDGETLPSEWISDRDVYAAGTTPTTGAEVAYKLATPTELTLTPAEIELLKGNNTITTDGKTITLEYLPDTLLSYAEKYTDVKSNELSVSIAQNKNELSVRIAQNTSDIEYLKEKSTKVYAMHIDGTESDPAHMITYLLDAVGMTPAYMDYTNDSFNYGSWGDTWLVKDVKPCILNKDGTVYAYLNKNDFTKDINGTDVTALIDGTTDNGQNVMIEFPKIWMKIVPDADDKSGTVYFSPIKVDDDYKDYAYIDYQGNHKEHFYMPAYNGSVVNDGTNDVMRSLSNKQVSKSLDATTEIQYCQNNGNGYNTEDAGEVMLINFLLMLIGKSTDTQTVFGKGLIEGGIGSMYDSFRTGVQNDKGMFYGTNSGDTATYTNAVKIFGIENWYGFQWRRYAGDINANGTRKIKLCYGTEDGSTVNDYNTDGSGYVNVGATPSGTSGGYISEMKFTEIGMFSKVSSGSSSTYYCDAQWYSIMTAYAHRGGAPNDAERVGAFYVYLRRTISDTGTHISAALSYK